MKPTTGAMSTIAISIPSGTGLSAVSAIGLIHRFTAMSARVCCHRIGVATPKHLANSANGDDGQVVRVTARRRAGPWAKAADYAFGSNPPYALCSTLLP